MVNVCLEVQKWIQVCHPNNNPLLSGPPMTLAQHWVIRTSRGIALLFKVTSVVTSVDKSNINWLKFSFPGSSSRVFSNDHWTGGDALNSR